ncbi:hypothetical protein [Candidatus Nitronereus thalassa]|uniref:Uncharacterized protein n=1 Tax=Candidatus Nitronereus thalassa TaxID=3020898 RepID=A0ABU3K6K7_9BACT|nr:hypothetical protein [Candidatus Nitronereus thalassa]MDT7042006.1 hypothetical protein [Candidatus Nitronereus thalassa]
MLSRLRARAEMVLGPFAETKACPERSRRRPRCAGAKALIQLSPEQFSSEQQFVSASRFDR